MGKDQSVVVLHQQLLLYPAAVGGYHEKLIVMVVLACMHPDGAFPFVNGIFITFLIVRRASSKLRGLVQRFKAMVGVCQKDGRRVQSLHTACAAEMRHESYCAFALQCMPMPVNACLSIVAPPAGGGLVAVWMRCILLRGPHYRTYVTK